MEESNRKKKQKKNITERTEKKENVISIWI